LYIFYLAYKIATSNIDENELETPKKPITFLQSMAFQWINPKAWAGALSTISIYIPQGDNFLKALFISAVLSAIVTIGAISAWALLGKEIKKFLKNPLYVKIFNYIMAFALIISVIMMLQ